LNYTETSKSTIEEKAVNSPSQEVEPFIDCVRAATLLGGIHPKTAERWAREGRIPAYRFFRRWCFRASELELWTRSHVNLLRHPCRLNEEKSDGS